MQVKALVEFLSGLRGPQEFAFFLHDGMRYGYEKSLQRHYNFRNFAELEQRWAQHAFRDQWSVTLLLRFDADLGNYLCNLGRPAFAAPLDCLSTERGGSSTAPELGKAASDSSPDAP